MPWKSNLYRYLPLVVAPLVSTWCGCSYPPKAGRADPVLLKKYPQIAVLENLHRAVVVTEVSEDPGPPLSVQVTARNKTRHDERHVQYRFFFLDTVGKPENPNPDWHYVHMPARTLVYFQGNALDRTCGAWRLEIRPAR